MSGRKGLRARRVVPWKAAVALTLLQLGPCANVQYPPGDTELFWGVAIAWGQDQGRSDLDCPNPADADIVLMLARDGWFGFPTPGSDIALGLETQAARALMSRLKSITAPDDRPRAAIGAMGVELYVKPAAEIFPPPLCRPIRS